MHLIINVLCFSKVIWKHRLNQRLQSKCSNSEKANVSPGVFKALQLGRSWHFKMLMSSSAMPRLFLVCHVINLSCIFSTSHFTCSNSNKWKCLDLGSNVFTRQTRWSSWDNQKINCYYYFIIGWTGSWPLPPFRCQGWVAVDIGETVRGEGLQSDLVEQVMSGKAAFRCC